MTLNPLIYAALKYYGTREYPGKFSHPLLRKWIDRFPVIFGKDDSKVKWCGVGMAQFFIDAGLRSLVPRKAYGAKQWAKVGRSVSIDEMRMGDIVILHATDASNWMGHVTLYINQETRTFRGLGANQSDEINISHFYKSKIADVRRINFYELEEYQPFKRNGLNLPPEI